MDKDVVLEAAGISKTYRGTGVDVEVLKDIGLAVRRAEIVGIVGASGVGKSTLLHILGSLEKPDTGEVRIVDKPIHALVGKELDRLRNRVIGFVFQFHFLMPEFTALENVMIPGMIGGADPRDASERAGFWLRRVGLENRLNHKPSELSGGEQQRVAVARALVNDPEVVLADEPTGNLDAETGDDIHRLIHSLSREQGKTFVVVTHKRDFARYADRVATLTHEGLSDVSLAG